MPFADPAAKAAYQARYRAARRAELARKQRGYYSTHRADQDAKHRDYLRARLLLRRAVSFANRSNQRAAIQGAPGKLWGRDVLRVVGPCAYCGGPATGWDHVVSMCQGGANEVANLVPACISCNRRKGGRWGDRTVRPAQLEEIAECLR